MNDSIIIGFSRPSKLWPLPLFAWAIMLFDWSNFSHAYIRFSMDAYDREMVFQASGLRVNFMPWTTFQTMEVIVHEFEIPVSAETKQAVIQYALDEVGTPYALLAAFGIIPVKIAALFGKKIKNPITQKGDWCSEEAAIVLKDYDQIPFTADQVRCMTPTDVYNYLVKVLG
jgi:hypothetical protein